MDFACLIEEGISIRHVKNCKDLEGKLYYLLPRDINIWFGEPTLKNKPENYSFNLSRVVNDRVYISLTEDVINDVKVRGRSETVHSPSAFFSDGSSIVNLNAIKIITDWYDIYKKSNKKKLIYIEGLLMKYEFSFIPKINNTTLSFLPPLVLEKANLFYFSNPNNDLLAYDNHSIPIKINFEDIYIDKKYLKLLLEDTVLGKAYQVPKEYQGYETLCNTAKLGYDIFVTGDVEEPKSNKDMVELIKSKKVFRNNKKNKTSVKEETAYFLIKPKISADAKVEYYNDGPQIKHLMNIPENMTYEEKKKKVMLLFKSESRWRQALKFITQKKI